MTHTKEKPYQSDPFDNKSCVIITDCNKLLVLLVIEGIKFYKSKEI